MKQGWLAAASLGFLLGGCSGGDENAPPAADKPSVGKPAADRKDHVWKGQVDAMDKAREVEGVLKSSAESQRRAAEDAASQ